MIRGLWDRETVALLLVAAALPIAAIWLLAEGTAAAGRLSLFLLFVGGWNMVFMLARAQPPSFVGIVTALTIAMLAPRDLSFWQLALGVSFGVVMAELVFGGWGRNILNPATVTLTFLGFGFPAAAWPDLAVQVGWAAVPAILIGWYTGVFSGQVILSALGVFVAAHMLGVDMADAFPAIAVVVVLLVCDPVASATTRAGRWLYGALFAGLSVMFAVHWEGAAPVQFLVSAALLASLAAPLLDEIVIAAWLAGRRRRLG